MSFVEDLITIKYVEEGYLPNFPYSMISRKELVEAFISNDVDTPCFFDDYYPEPDDSLSQLRRRDLRKYLKDSLLSAISQDTPAEDWIYGYMLGNVISPKSDEYDVDDLKTLLSFKGSEFPYSQCYQSSSTWLGYNSSASAVVTRPPTIYGEMHVIKFQRTTEVTK